MTKEKPENVKAYIAQFPNKMQQKLQEVLACLKEFVPEAEISLKWGTPAFTYRRVLFTIAAFKQHINFYPTPTVLHAFKEELASYLTTKST